jgi:drug/metabolite transporter (DMT)-like permease
MMRDRRAVQLGALMCTLSAACYAGLSILAKLAQAAGLTLTGMLSLRFLGAAAFLAAILLIQRRALFAGTRTMVRLLLLGALLYAPQAALFFTGLQRLPASVAVLLLYVYPVIVAAFDWVFNRRLPDSRTVAALVLAMFGVVLTLVPQRTTPVDPIGAVLVLASATGLAVYIILSERATRTSGARVGAMGIVFGAGLSFTLAGAATGTLEWPLALAEPLLVLGLIVIGTVLPVTLFLAGVGRVGPTGASLLSTLEPVFTVALGAIILQESLVPVQWLGGGCILAASLLVATRPTRAVEASPTM